MTLDNWDDFTSGSFLKAINVNSDQDAFSIKEVDEFEDLRDNTTKPRLTLIRGDKEYIFDLNKTNAARLKELGVVSPIALKGKKLYFKKALVRNPKTNMEVDGLRIAKIE